MLGNNSAPAAPTYPNWDPGLWSALETVLWVFVVVFILIRYREQIQSLLTSLVLRIRGGAAVKIFGIEFGGIRVASNGRPTSKRISARIDENGKWREARNRLYEQNKHVFIAHRLFPSEQSGQTYDILVYLMPHSDRGGTLTGITHVEYYFGNAWGNQVFTANDCSNRFAILISAFGEGFLCTARLHFLDKSIVDTWRYIDFEMGPLGENIHSINAVEDQKEI